jgi:small subunit ribosomal protein S20
MANHFSALKRARQTEKKTEVNRSNKSRLRTALRGLRESISAGDRKSAETNFRATVSVIDKAIQKGTIHKNTAARYKSRLSVRLNAVAAK